MPHCLLHCAAGPLRIHVALSACCVAPPFLHPHTAVPSSSTITVECTRLDTHWPTEGFFRVNVTAAAAGGCTGARSSASIVVPVKDPAITVTSFAPPPPPCAGTSNITLAYRVATNGSDQLSLKAVLPNFNPFGVTCTPDKNQGECKPPLLAAAGNWWSTLLA